MEYENDRHIFCFSFFMGLTHHCFWGIEVDGSFPASTTSMETFNVVLHGSFHFFVRGIFVISMYFYWKHLSVEIVEASAPSTEVFYHFLHGNRFRERFHHFH